MAIYRQPPVSSVNNIFTLPFALSVWIVMIFLSVVFTVTITFLTWMLNKLKGGKTRLSDALDTITMVLGAICQQGLSNNVHSMSMRLATFTLFLSSLFVFTSYSASIVVMLQSSSNAIKDVRDLADKPITFSVQDTRHNYIYFNETNDRYIKKIYQQKIIPQGSNAFTNPEKGMERVRSEFHSFLVEITLAYHIIANKWLDHEKCSLSETELYKIPLLTLYVTKKSGYKDVFKQKMIQQHEVGLRFRTNRNLMPQKQKCDSTDTHVTKFDSISLKDIYPALLFLGCGIFTSLFLFFIEIIYKTKSIKMLRQTKIK